MRFTSYINESPYTLDTGVFEMFKKDCSQYLKHMKRLIPISDFPYLVRGTHDIKAVVTKVPRRDRRPLDSPQEWHDALDKAFKAKFGIKARSEGVFCKMNKKSGYGIDYIVIPFNGYYCIWSDDVTDAYVYFKNNTKSDKTTDEMAEYVVSTMEKGSLVDASRSLGGDSESEIILICKKYYMLKMDHKEQLLEWVKNEI